VLKPVVIIGTASGVMPSGCKLKQAGGTFDQIYDGNITFGQSPAKQSNVLRKTSVKT
jgi:hypothetical protein